VAPCGALPEVCGGAALYADPDRPEEWVRHIRALADDATLRQPFQSSAFGSRTMTRYTGVMSVIAREPSIDFQSTR